MSTNHFTIDQAISHLQSTPGWKEIDSEKITQSAERIHRQLSRFAPLNSSHVSRLQASELARLQGNEPIENHSDSENRSENASVPAAHSKKKGNRGNNANSVNFAALIPFSLQQVSRHNGAEGDECSVDDPIISDHQEVISLAKERIKLGKKECGHKKKQSGGKFKTATVINNPLYLGPTVASLSDKKVEALSQKYQDLLSNPNTTLEVVSHGNPLVIGSKEGEPIDPELFAELFATSIEDYALLCPKEVRCKLVIGSCNSAKTFTLDEIDEFLANPELSEKDRETLNELRLLAPNNSFIDRVYNALHNRGFTNITVKGYAGYLGVEQRAQKSIVTTQRGVPLDRQGHDSAEVCFKEVSSKDDGNRKITTGKKFDTVNKQVVLAGDWYMGSDQQWNALNTRLAHNRFGLFASQAPQPDTTPGVSPRPGG